MIDALGIFEIAELLDKTTEQVSMMHHRKKLPPADGTVGGGRTKLWERETIERWMKEEQ